MDNHKKDNAFAFPFMINQVKKIENNSESSQCFESDDDVGIQKIQSNIVKEENKTNLQLSKYVVEGNECLIDIDSKLINYLVQKSDKLDKSNKSSKMKKVVKIASKIKECNTSDSSSPNNTDNDGISSITSILEVKSKNSKSSSSLYNKCIPNGLMKSNSNDYKSILSNNIKEKKHISSLSNSNNEVKRKHKKSNSISICQDRVDFKEEPFDEESKIEDVINNMDKLNFIASHEADIIKDKNDIRENDYNKYHHSQQLHMMNKPNNDYNNPIIYNIYHQESLNLTSNLNILQLNNQTSQFNNIDYSSINSNTSINPNPTAYDQAKFIQLQALIKSNQINANMLLPQFLNYFMNFCKDPHGNYLAQQIISKVKHNDLFLITNCVIMYFKELYYHSYGTRVIQKMIDLSIEPVLSMLKGIIYENLMLLCKDHNGIHILYKYINTSKDIQFVYNFLYNNITNVSTDKEGCCLIQKILECNLYKYNVSTCNTYYYNSSFYTK